MNTIPEESSTQFDNAQVMNAVVLTRSPEVGRVADYLEWATLPIVRPGAHEVAIRLCASSMHIDEIYAAQGTALGRFYQPKNISQVNPHVLGSSVSGIIVGLGSQVVGFKLGDEVIVIPDETPETGSWADYRCVKDKSVMLKPDELTHVEAAAITMAACVAWGAIGFGQAKAGDRCLVVGASSSIGVMIVQYLHILGCHVTGVCSSRNADMVLHRGADAVVDYAVENFVDRAQLYDEYYDTVFDCIGGLQIEKDGFRALKRTGIFETVVGPVQHIGETKLSRWDFAKVVTHVLSRMFFTLFRGPRYRFGAKYPRYCIQAALEQAVNHQLRMPVERTIPFQLDAITTAIELLLSHRSRGRIVIDFDRQKTPVAEIHQRDFDQTARAGVSARMYPQY